MHLFSLQGNHLIRAVDLDTGEVSTAAGSGVRGYRDGVGTAAQLCEPSGTVPRAERPTRTCSSRLFQRRPPRNARPARLTGVAVDPYGGALYITDACNHVVRVMDLDTSRVSTLAGSPRQPGFVNGRRTASMFSRPLGLGLHLRDRQLFVCDSRNHAVSFHGAMT